LIDKLAREGNPTAIPLPKPGSGKPKVEDFNFSFSGLKTAVRQITEGVRWSDEKPLADLCASFQEIVVDVLIEKTMAAAKQKRCKTIVVTGGVACNSRLREKFQKLARSQKMQVYFPTPLMSTDNAAMIAYVGGRYLLAGKSSPLSLNAVANSDLTKLSA
jgi:N6-L-threonylcarbamoyladenine synthase